MPRPEDVIIPFGSVPPTAFIRGPVFTQQVPQRPKDGLSVVLSFGRPGKWFVCRFRRLNNGIPYFRLVVGPVSLIVVLRDLDRTFAKGRKS